MSYWILTSQGTVISWKTVQRITYPETQTADNKERFRLFDLSIHEFFKDEIIVTESQILPLGQKLLETTLTLRRLSKDYQ